MARGLITKFGDYCRLYTKNAVWCRHEVEQHMVCNICIADDHLTWNCAQQQCNDSRCFTCGIVMQMTCTCARFTVPSFLDTRQTCSVPVDTIWAVSLQRCNHSHCFTCGIVMQMTCTRARFTVQVSRILVKPVLFLWTPYGQFRSSAATTATVLHAA